MSRTPLLATLCASISLSLSTMAQADAEIEAAAQMFAEQTAASWVADPIILNAIRAQNAKNAGLTQDDVDELDKRWRQETSSANSPLINEIVGNSLSDYLRGVKEESQGLMTEIFVMDDKGLNVGQSDVTSDLWQGDEAKWQKTYQAEPRAIFIDSVEMDESTQRFQTQISIAVEDPDTGKNIGAVTIGVDAEGLLMQ